MHSEETFREKICRWLGFHIPHNKWEHNGLHAYCFICGKFLDKVNKKWYTWDKSPENPTVKEK